MNNNAYTKFINFFKSKGLYDEELFEYVKKHLVSFNYEDKEYRPLIGTYTAFKNKKLIFLKVIAPYIDSDITILINIHEFSHAIYYIKNKNKASKIGAELIALLYEELYISENPSKELLEFQKKLNNSITENAYEYFIALNKVPELLKYYNEQKDSNNIEKNIYKKVKKIILKEKNKN